MQYDEIHKLPEPLPHELKEEELLYQEFSSANCRFILFEARDGEPKIRFDKLDACAYANYVAVLSAPHNKKAYEFLKLVMEGARLVLLKKKNSLKEKGVEAFIPVSEPTIAEQS